MLVTMIPMTKNTMISWTLMHLLVEMVAVLVMDNKETPEAMNWFWDGSLYEMLMALIPDLECVCYQDKFAIVVDVDAADDDLSIFGNDVKLAQDDN